MTWIVRAAIVLWGAFFLFMGVNGMINPDVYLRTFGFPPLGVGINTIRGDMSSFMIVSALCGLGGAIWTRHRALLLVPAALFGCALLARLVGVMLGDVVDDGIKTSMISELITAALMISAYVIFGRQQGSAIASDNPS